MTRASRFTRSRPAPASVRAVPITSSAATTTALKSRPTQGLRRSGWILREDSRHHVLIGHAVQDARLSDDGDQRGVGDRDHGDHREQVDHEVGRDRDDPLPDHLEEGGRGLRPTWGRHGQRGCHRDQDVDDAGHDHAADQRARERTVRVDGLLGDVRGVLEPRHREERECDSGEDRQRRAALGVELRERPEVGVALGDVPDADDHHDHQAGDLDERHQHVDHHRLGDADEVHDRQTRE